MLGSGVLSVSKCRRNNILMFWNNQKLSPIITFVIVVIKSHPLAILFFGVDLTQPSSKVQLLTCAPSPQVGPELPISTSPVVLPMADAVSFAGLSGQGGWAMMPLGLGVMTDQIPGTNITGVFGPSCSDLSMVMEFTSSVSGLGMTQDGPSVSGLRTME